MLRSGRNRGKPGEKERIADDSEFFHLVLGDDDDDLEFLYLVLGDDDDGGDDLEFPHLVLQPFGGVETANGRYLRVADPASNEDQHTFHITVTTFDISWDIFFDKHLWSKDLILFIVFSQRSERKMSAAMRLPGPP